MKLILCINQIAFLSRVLDFEPVHQGFRGRTLWIDQFLKISILDEYQRHRGYYPFYKVFSAIVRWIFHVKENNQIYTCIGHLFASSLFREYFSNDIWGWLLRLSWSLWIPACICCISLFYLRRNLLCTPTRSMSSLVVILTLIKGWKHELTFYLTHFDCPVIANLEKLTFRRSTLDFN